MRIVLCLFVINKSLHQIPSLVRRGGRKARVVWLAVRKLYHQTASQTTSPYGDSSSPEEEIAQIAIGLLDVRGHLIQGLRCLV